MTYFEHLHRGSPGRQGLDPGASVTSSLHQVVNPYHEEQKPLETERTEDEVPQRRLKLQYLRTEEDRRREANPFTTREQTTPHDGAEDLLDRQGPEKP